MRNDPHLVISVLNLVVDPVCHNSDISYGTLEKFWPQHTPLPHPNLEVNLRGEDALDLGASSVMQFTH